MAPEQIEGAPVTPSVDIYALGIVMFEMVTGVRPFIGDTPFSTALKRLHEPPPSPTDFAPDLNPAWSEAILRCLRRDPAERFRTGSEIVAALTGGPFETVSTRAVRLTAPAKRRHVLLAAAAGVVILAGVAWWSRPSSPAAGRLGGGNLVQVVSSQARAYDPVLSPDGRMLAYVAAGADGQIDLFIGDARGEGRVRLTDDAAREEDPRISPDGTRLAFTRLRPDATSAEIWTVPALGGQPMLLIPNAAFPAWSPDGRQLAFVHRPNPSAPPVLATANADGSDVRTILAADGAYLNVRAPAWSPDRQEIAFIWGRGGVAGELWIVPAAGGSPRRVSNDTTAVFSDDPVFTPDGESIVHSSNRGGATNIWITPRNGGAPARLTTGPGPDQSPSMARDGTLAFGSSRWRNVLLTQPIPEGPSRTLVTHSPYLWAPAFSPDGLELAYSQGETDGSWHLWTVRVDGSAEPRRLTATEHGEIYPRFTTDGAYILFQNWNEPRRLWRVPRAGGAPELLPIAQEPGDAYADLSPDGRRVAFVRVDNQAEHVYLANIGGGPARRLTTVPGSVPNWSPDGRWIAFARDRSYSGGVLVVRSDGSGLRRLTDRGGWPVWWPDGSQIAYLAVGQDGNQTVEIVSAAGGPSRRLESLRYTDTNYPIAISPDGTLIATSNASHVSDEIWLLQSRTD